MAKAENTEDSDDTEHEPGNDTYIRNWKKFAIAAGFCVVALWVFLGFVPLNSLSYSDFGNLGGGFGMAESLFSGLAFVGVIVAIVLQSGELRLQREELRLQRLEVKANRVELKRSADAQEETKKILLLTAYLNTFQAVLSGYMSKSSAEQVAAIRPATRAAEELMARLHYILAKLELPNAVAGDALAAIQDDLAKVLQFEINSFGRLTGIEVSKHPLSSSTPALVHARDQISGYLGEVFAVCRDAHGGPLAHIRDYVKSMRGNLDSLPESMLHQNLSGFCKQLADYVIPKDTAL